MTRQIGPLALLLTGCSTLFLQTDGFPGKVEEQCKSEASCALLMGEANGRIAACHDNTIGSVKCSDARGDLAMLQGRIDAFRMARNLRESKEMAKRREASELRDDERKAVEFEAKRERDEHERLARLADARSRAWATAMLAACEKDLTPSCGTPEDIPASVAAECDVVCKRTRVDVLTLAHATALAACIVRVVKADGRGSVVCEAPKFPASVTAAEVEPLKAKCDRGCAELAPQAVKEARERARAEKAEAARIAAHGRMHVKCCDGSRSPTCTYANERSGCCSNHGGSCGED